MVRISFEALLARAILLFFLASLKSRGFEKHFWAEIASRVHQFTGGIWGVICVNFASVANGKHIK